MKVPLIDVYEKVVWPLEDLKGNCHDAFMVSIESPEEVFDTLELDANWTIALKEEIAKRMEIKALKVRGTFELSCHSVHGVGGVRDVLLKSKKEANELSDNMEIEILVISSPLFEIFTTTTHKSKGIEVL